MPAVAYSIKRRLHKWTTGAFMCLVALTIVEYGSVGDVERDLAVIAFGVLAAFSIFRPVGAAIARVRAVAILLLAALVTYVALQALPSAAGPFANAAWQAVSDHVAPVEATISVAPAMTFDALPTLALPFLVFLSALALFQGDGEALLLWRALAYFGAGYAVFALAQQVFSPDQMLFQTKTYYVGSLTGTFINRNTAGTFFGLVLLLNLGLFFADLRGMNFRSFVSRMTHPDVPWRDKQGLIAHALFSLLALISLFLTQSRGAAAATFVALVVAIVLSARRRIGSDQQPSVFDKLRPVLAGLIGLVCLAVLYEMFAGRVGYRIQQQGVDDTRWCAYASMVQAIKDHPLFGSGFGSFQDVFPLYRQSDCTGIFGVWDRAHDSFLEGYLGLGLPFAAAAAVCYIVLIGVFARGILSRNRMRFAPVMALASLILVSLHAMIDFSLQIPGFAVYFSALLASGVTLSLSRTRGSAG